MKRYVVECDICGEEITGNDWHEIKSDYIFLAHGMKMTRHEKTVICCACRAAFIKAIRNWRV